MERVGQVEVRPGVRSAPGTGDVLRLYLGSVGSLLGPATPIHGYVIRTTSGAVLVDAGHRVDVVESERRRRGLVARQLDDALGDHGLTLTDITAVIATHLHRDHAGQLISLPGRPLFVQRLELERARRDEVHDLSQLLESSDVAWELLDGDATLFDDVEILATPGHTVGHQSVLIRSRRTELIVGDAAYTTSLYREPDSLLPDDPVSPIQIGDRRTVWRSSIERLKSANADVIHFCHDAECLRRGGAQRSVATT